MIRELLQDTRYGARMQESRLNLSVVPSLALAIRAISTYSSFVNGIMLRPLPYPEPERLVLLDETAFNRGIPLIVSRGQDGELLYRLEAKTGGRFLAHG